MHPSKILWFGFVMSTVIYMIVLVALAPEPTQSYEESLRALTTMLFYAVALATFVMGWIVPNRIAAPPKTRMIIRLAYFEACAINGFIAAFLQHDWRVYIAPWVLALIGFVNAFPKEDEIAA